ncbi:hypothetical protein GGI04_004738 [Coemansia thaxteri]|uniref:Urease accessory protein UreD n=1 Tax=Coemansia thaxteri TaxID=2663907 RepID=A0A9W8BMF3_9FUNG|nr:hypothetical protein GGI04_004738 [Coemansia thaxteri]KAJ2006947.1 hypothetical protein H4R26_001088 [Coemansia thaxteri]KAJ2465809.1 hypothetical protein GGI02_004582 [Coemansia sp. RSA 2322]KAJ2487649.1 hypothetical protein EV174_000406 [Coemansia sp. RSA 2320]
MPASPGAGIVDCQVVAGRLCQAVSSAYPLKIIAPHAFGAAAASSSSSSSLPHPLVPAACYLMSYGGGIVHGDRIHVDVRAGTGCALMLLTQGSTKVFRHRAGRMGLKQRSESVSDDQSFQTILAHVEPGALLCLLPDPVTCFKSAVYSQRQAVTLHGPTASVLLLDWMTSGRMSRGERWAFEKYFSVNLILNQQPLGPDSSSSRVVIRDALLLEHSSLHSLHHLDAFALMLVLGPAVAAVAQVFRDEHRAQRIKPFRPTATASDFEEDERQIRWSVSEVDEHGICGVAVRAAGPSTEALKTWIKRRLAPLKSVMGDAAWSMYAN